jgi:hypothetical protein
MLLDVWGALWQTQWSRAVSTYFDDETFYPVHLSVDLNVNPHAVLRETPDPVEVPGNHRHRRRPGRTPGLSCTVEPTARGLAVHRP